MLEDLCENDSYEVLKKTAEDRSAWRERNARPPTRPVLTGNGNRAPVNSGRQLG